MSDKLRTAVIGAGKMGRLHSRIYSEMDDVELVGIVDVRPERAEALAAQYGGRALPTAADLLGSVDAVTISAPTDQHAALARPFLERGVSVLVEKPLAENLADCRALLELSRAHGCTLQVGYSERFNPVVQALRRLEFIPRFIEAQRISPFTFRSTDVGVVFDMMIHDLDIILALVRSPVRDVQAVGVHVVGEHEDIANVRLLFESGCVANLTASRLALKTERKVRVFSEMAYLSLDYLKKKGVVVHRARNVDLMGWLRAHVGSGGELDVESADWTELVQVEDLDIDEREPLRLEQEAFVAAVRAGSRPEVSAEDAIAATELAERITAAVQAHRWETPGEAPFSARSWREALAADGKGG